MLQDHEIPGEDEEMIPPSSVIASYDSDGEDNSTQGSHPTVLVWKNGQPLRMFRCHICPQVFVKLSDLQDHEEEHNSDTGSLSNSNEAINLSLKNSRSSTPIPSTVNNPNSLLKVNYNNLTGQTSSGVEYSTPKSVLYFCDECPARFFYEKELRIHHTFHVKASEFKCQLCSYSARQQVPHLMSHMKVHGREYQAKTQLLLAKYPKASSIDLDFQSELRLFTPSISITPAITSSKSSPNGFYGSRTTNKPDASINCDKCPAKFNTMASFVQHRNNHGRPTTFSCRYCDYGADSGNNLTLHEILHAGSEITIEPEPNTRVSPSLYRSGRKAPDRNISISQVREDGHQSPAIKQCEDWNESNVYGGNPEFVYPTYMKNGRVKSKRYKCNKCPSAFEKRDQYRVHVGLHGSDQRYKCTVCDYAVTYYANYIQHLKKHENQPNVDPELLVVKPFSKIKYEQLAANSISPEAQNDSGMEDAASGGTDDDAPKRSIRCPRCPYGSKDYAQFQEHLSHHLKFNPELMNGQSVHKCLFCDFVTLKKNMLRDHVRLHFHATTNNNACENKPSPSRHMFAEDIQIFLKHGNDNDEERVFCEKENNYTERRQSHEGGLHSNITVTNKSSGGSLIDLRRGLPVSMLSDDGGDSE
jgi:hypothetical protein